MNWQDITRNPDPVVEELRQHFPATDPDEVLKTDKERAVEKLARANDLTRREAQVELDDLMFATDLRRYRRKA
ncbi:hypothetical protein [Pelagovum pacificum]|uniref:Uncharacterized protein n=1 Tax=Pelagovum pacificum TaxID=2588711 RepID=A0A5C5GC69_9RHOB|nr:hypothetical protein [Pelagovum pacificum]QQA44782.1 hypothetical protein I8N54_09515 [Pelagovum pacificum]TNY32110.1 hypothetical protein FHY64_02080 [Pelagovum pacificum]